MHKSRCVIDYYFILRKIIPKYYYVNISECYFMKSNCVFFSMYYLPTKPVEMKCF